ncbi:MAG: PHP domain-containing protein [Clostridiales bacterium]|nr:PHP domain-containing protein [Clostridiales bacterium]
MAADLHCHTKLSNGSLGIDNLVVLAKKRGIATIAITDHDCLAGNVRGKIIGERYGVNVIPGVEISATDRKRGVRADILCYLPDSPDRLEGLCRNNLLIRKKASQYMMLSVASRFPVTMDFMAACASGSTGVYKQHIMHALMEAGMTNEIYGDLYRELFSSDSPDNILRETLYPDPSEVLKAIHDAGGIAVMAHPVLFNNYELLDELIGLGLDGIEVWHPSCDEEDIVYLQQKAKKHNLLMTGGSDFHGMYGYNKTTIGSATMPDDRLDALMSYKSRRRRQKARMASESNNDENN